MLSGLKEKKNMSHEPLNTIMLISGDVSVYLRCSFSKLAHLRHIEQLNVKFAGFI